LTYERSLHLESFYLLAPAAFRPDLNLLDISHNNLSDHSLDVLTGAQPPDLETLRLSYNHLSDEAPEALASVSWPRLTALDLSGNGISGRDAMVALFSSSFPALSHLDLSYTGADDQDVTHLVSQAGAARLKELRFHGARLGNDAVEAIARSPHLANL